MNTLWLWVFQTLFIILTGANELNNFPENFMVVRMNHTATLTCGQQPTGPVVWKFNDQVLSKDLFDISVDPVSQKLTVRNVDTPMMGKYTCWMGDKELLSTHLLLEHEDGWLADFLNCRAKSYDCTFSCTWTRSDTAVRLGLGHDCAKGEKSCQWVTNSDRHDGGFEFELSHSLLPYSEESSMLKVTAEAIVNLSVLRGTKEFYLRDIVQPDSPKIVNCHEVQEELNVTIEPPSTWSTPHSFFRLEHEIEYLLRDDGKTERSSSAVIPKRISKLRVRSRDPLVVSPWSQWTPWKNVRTGKKLCKCKNKAKFCCPELPAGYLEQCEKRKMKKKERKMQS
ncbi:interleukin-12 subunit beta isoform X2 [Betta splendens]|uniref:Interleukin-12 subunit beta n=1 Tax=Betta splendens TaxID=158456 RepID=A0A6P7NNU6_BETSP|nr:interleukin-12 subunit beta isoform X2 [Betta splendens]